MFLRNVGKYQHNNTALHPGRREYSRDTAVRTNKSRNFTTYKEITSYFLRFFGLICSSFPAFRVELLNWTLYVG